MEEIILLQDNIEKKTYLNLFNDNFHDENYLKIGNYKLEEYKLYVYLDNQIHLVYDYIEIKNNIKYFKILKDTNENNIILSIVHYSWEDNILLDKDKNRLKRLNNNDSANYELKNNMIIIKWDNYEQEIFILDKDTKKYNIKDKNKRKTIYIKNESWEEECDYDINTNILKRLHCDDEKGHIILENNYLTIQWEKWNQELFYYNNNNQYQNNIFFIKKIILNINENEEYYYDKNYIYDKNYHQKLFESKIYKYKINNNILTLFDLENNKLNDFCRIDNIYYHFNKLKNIILDDKKYYIFYQENLIIDLDFLVIGKFKNININNLDIQFYNELKDNIYSIIDKNNLLYLTPYNDNYQIYIDHEIIYLNEKTKYLVSDNKNQLVIEQNNKFNIYHKLNNYYFNQKDYHFLINCHFNEETYTFFENNYNNIIKKIVYSLDKFFMEGLFFL